MTDFASLLLPDRGQSARTVQTVSADGFEAWLATQPARARASVAAAGFKGKPGEVAILAGDGPEEWGAVAGVPATPGPWDLAAAAAKLPGGTYRIEGGKPGEAALGWLLAHYRFSRYRSEPEAVEPRVLLTAEPAGIARIVRLAQATALVRDLVNTPAEDMGPAELAAAARAEAEAFGASVRIVDGALLAKEFPAIHAVGRAAAKPPCLIDLSWGNPSDPKVTLVGKGVCFDSGGLDIKPSSAMLLMKKDMGGAAHALALARLAMQAKLKVRLRLLIPAVENAISGDAFRPGDVLASRKGVTIEIGNTDAEGRLVLCDALALAQEDKPALLLDFATLTGAARVALGPELPAMFANDDTLAAEIEAAAKAASDPLWRMPLWAGYRDMLKSEVADINNSADSGFAGAVTAALFLERFIEPGQAWAHVDLFAWNPAPKPGRPKGGEAMTLRAMFAMLEARFGG
ncbi:M17 family metallopeptidase [Bradyrhizobium sp.]|uniref:leucyl aminopeptidase family protein n=1 Tax=Bradyrhizobium sp. TaxID=376 RepID=UPI0025BAFD81|nr:leucyl aminopeptidase family protein [Bradyrhizobium sp.]MCA3567469.1 leucyl aminopeptidase family protein [Bradyrhizobium sp.]